MAAPVASVQTQEDYRETAIPRAFLLRGLRGRDELSDSRTHIIKKENIGCTSEGCEDSLVTPRKLFMFFCV